MKFIKLKRKSNLSRAEKVLSFFISCAVIFIILGLTIMSVYLILPNKKFYSWQFKKNNTYENLELSKEQLHMVRDKMIDYLLYKTDDLQLQVTYDGDEFSYPFFTKRELSHMADARAIFRRFLISAFIMVTVAVVTNVTVYFLIKKKFKEYSYKKVFSRGAFSGGKVFIISGAILLISIALGFDAVFDVFHKIFFPQGNWKFHPFSNLTTMLPRELFVDSAIILLTIAFSLAAAFMTLGYIINKKSGNK